ncbi:MAG: NYN domain-containing protein [Steroidobacter sp.]
MTRVAVLIDLGFFLPRYKRLIERGSEIPHTPRQVAQKVFRTALRHVHQRRGEDLYRIFVYDCKPLSKRAHSPITEKAIDFSKTPQYKFRTELHKELVCLRKVALRLGELMDDSRWIIRPEPLKNLLRKKITIDQLTDDDLQYDVSQKGVDIKFGIDIASLAYKKLVEKVVLITGDSDFVPAAKLARREGLDVVLDPLWNPIAQSLHEHIDGLKSVWPNPAVRKEMRSHCLTGFESGDSATQQLVVEGEVTKTISGRFNGPRRNRFRRGR